MVSLQFIEDINSEEQRKSFYREIEKINNPSGILVSTCNRMEYYWGEGYIPEDVVSHLFSVTSGIKSNLIGDTSIQGQVKEAYQNACDHKKLNKSLHKLFQTALFVGKKVRNETKLSSGSVGYSQAVLEILCRHKLLLNNSRITIIGVNNINEKIIRCLARNGAGTILIGNRTLEKARKLSEKYNCNSFSFDKLKETLAQTDILISATSAPHQVVPRSIFPNGKQMFILDLAVPNDVDQTIGTLNGVKLINLSQIEKMVNQNLDKRTSEVHKGKEIIKSEVLRFMTYQQTSTWKN